MLNWAVDEGEWMLPLAVLSAEVGAVLEAQVWDAILKAAGTMYASPLSEEDIFADFEAGGDEGEFAALLAVVPLQTPQGYASYP